MARRKIYAVYDNGVLLGHYTSKEASARIGIPCATVSAYASSGAKYRGRYTMECVGLCDTSEEEWIDAWASEWDQVRQEKLDWLRGGGAVGQENTGAVHRCLRTD